MAATKPTYDIVLLLDTNADDEVRAKVVADVEAMITSGGELIGKHPWGRRHLAFEIDHKSEAEYHLFQFHGTPELLANLNRTLRITDGVVRFRIVKLAPGTPPPPDMRASATPTHTERLRARPRAVPGRRRRRAHRRGLTCARAGARNKTAADYGRNS